MGLDPALPPSLIDRLSEIERRLGNIERSPQLMTSSIRGGSFRVYDDAGVAVMKIGDLGGGEAGVEIYDTVGTVILKLLRTGTLRNWYTIAADGSTAANFGVFNDGLDATRRSGIRVVEPFLTEVLQASSEKLWEYPLLAAPWNDISSFKAVTSGTFVDLWRSRHHLVPGKHVRVVIVTSGDASTTGEVRISHNAGGQTSAKTVPAGAFSTLDFKWDLATTIANPFDIEFTVQARRTSGAGNVNVYAPSPLHVGRVSGATTTG